jgi:hypothetical protein
MRNHGPSLLLCLLALASACTSDSESPAQPDAALPTEDAGTPSTAHSEQPAGPTYWKDMVPLFEQHCLQCHRDGGIAPFRMDEYSAVKPLAKLIARATSERTMPPWAVTSDGSCGTFADSLALSDDEIAKVAAWADNGAAEGEPGTIELPEAPTLADAAEFITPEFTPEAQGGKLAENDEYRCFVVDRPEGATGYVTGYEVIPGREEIVHHLVAFIIDPEGAASGEDGKPTSMTNRERMQQLNDESPDRLGWPCFGAAGEGVEIEGLPVVWAPGQGVVNFPKGTGVPLEEHHQVVIQIHYNLSDIKHRGLTDSTTLRLALAQEVDEVGVFVTEDPLLSSLYEDEPTTLPPGKSSTHYVWKNNFGDMGLDEIKGAKLYGVMPHMHALGRTYNMTITQPGAGEQCVAKVDNWNFHWQRMYFWEKPYELTGDTQLAVDCEYDTSSVVAPVEPGWGTSNEMCLATLFFTVPREHYKDIF